MGQWFFNMFKDVYTSYDVSIRLDSRLCFEDLKASIFWIFSGFVSGNLDPLCRSVRLNLNNMPPL